MFIDDRAAAKNLPLGDTLMLSGKEGIGKGEPETGVSVPFDPMLKAEMLLDPGNRALPAYRNWSFGVTANEM